MSRRCAITACDRTAVKRGMCGMHYLRWWKHGDPLFIPIRSYRRPVLDRLLDGAIRLANGCLIFAGGPPHKYGQMQVDNVAELAHRVSYREQIGPIPDGMQVLHRCDTPRCIEPACLFLGTQLDNMHDMIGKGRQVVLSGEAAPWSKLTTGAVRAIRQSSETNVALAASYQVSASCISLARRGKRWDSL